jgi:hypothetical protein
MRAEIVVPILREKDYQGGSRHDHDNLQACGDQAGLKEPK